MVDGIEQLRIPMKREWFAILFLPFWLVGWSVGWVVAARELTQHFDLFIAGWLGAWTVGGAFAIGLLTGQLFGAEIVRVVGRDLEVRIGAGPLKRVWRYRGDAIENLTSWAPDVSMFGWGRYQRPFWMRPRTGAVKFDYGADSIFLGTGIDEPEGRAVADWLARRLPRSATELR